MERGIWSPPVELRFGLGGNRTVTSAFEALICLEDIWPKRYAIWGRLVAAQPDQIAYIVFDASSLKLFMPSLYPPIPRAWRNWQTRRV